MPYLKFDNPKGSADNKGSCSLFADYLSKEDFKIDPLDKEFFFNHNSNIITTNEVIQAIDKNRNGLSKKDSKFYTGSINFSEEELKFIDNNKKKIKDYTVKVMEKYADNFNKGLTINDINWFAKIEFNRYYKGDDTEVIEGKKKQGDIKEGLNTHVHFIVGRKSKDGSKKLSPKTNHINTNKGAVKGGFSRDNFKQEGEKLFDQFFSYLRPLEDTYQFNKTIKNGELNERENALKDKLDNDYRKKKYAHCTNNEKEQKIKNLANFICHGQNRNELKKIDVNKILEFEKKSNYKGYIYRALINLSSQRKLGNAPNEYDLTSNIISNAKFLQHRNNFTNRISTVENQKETTKESFKEYQSVLPDLSEILMHNSPSHILDEDEEEWKKKKKKKKRRNNLGL